MPSRPGGAALRPSLRWRGGCTHWGGSSSARLVVKYHWIARPGLRIDVTPERRLPLILHQPLVHVLPFIPAPELQQVGPILL
jgi:hypothetical protein